MEEPGGRQGRVAQKVDNWGLTFELKEMK